MQSFCNCSYASLKNEQLWAKEKSTVVEHRKGSGIAGHPTPTKAPTSTQLDDQKSLTPFYALQLGSFPWFTAANAYVLLL